jgi:hypothetical protein
MRYIRTNRRRQNRMQGVLPVRVRGKDNAGTVFDGLAHTLDLTSTGARLGAIHHQLTTLDTVVVLYRQRRIEFTVMWTKLLDGQSEFQIGLQVVAHECDPWGLNSVQCGAPLPTGLSAASRAA